MEPCGTPTMILAHVLKELLTFVLCFLADK